MKRTWNLKETCIFLSFCFHCWATSAKRKKVLYFPQDILPGMSGIDNTSAKGNNGWSHGSALVHSQASLSKTNSSGLTVLGGYALKQLGYIHSVCLSHPDTFVVASASSSEETIFSFSFQLESKRCIWGYRGDGQSKDEKKQWSNVNTKAWGIPTKTCRLTFLWYT